MNARAERNRRRDATGTRAAAGAVWRGILLVACALGATAWSGCIGVKLYLDPAFRTAQYRDIRMTVSPIPVRVEYVFYRNDVLLEKGAPILEKKAKRVLESTRVFRPDPAARDTLRIALTNSGDVGQAVAKGLGTGISLGIVGSRVVDHYTMRVRFIAADGREFGGSYEHALHSTIGVKSAPAGMLPILPADAFDQVVEDQLLRYLVDFQAWRASQDATQAAQAPDQLRVVGQR